MGTTESIQRLSPNSILPANVSTARSVVCVRVARITCAAAIKGIIILYVQLRVFLASSIYINYAQYRVGVVSPSYSVEETKDIHIP